MSKLVFAHNTRTGKETLHPVPEHWIGHPVLGKNLTKTKPAAAGGSKKEAK